MRAAISVSHLGFRVLRSALFAAVSVGMALVGHAAAGGPTPEPTVLWGIAGGVALGAVPLAGRRCSAVTLCAGLLATQALLHLAFLHTAPHPPGGAGPHAELAGPTHAGTLAGAGVGEVVMLLAHVWAALVTGWWLASGEDALWTVLRWLSSVLLPSSVRAGNRRVPQPGPAPGWVPMVAPQLRMLRHVRDGRAPPRPRV
ncbi:hypothetical protein [Halostreptopolyspora alba]|uniref:MFS transporter n=1 Tax=Halostreptopolyspora alba TaxID=2487137 RepID=A0A3N0E1U9_9ACTN|nr:hypothetical protein EFW17_21480 [Nocardiopsaceae bacterium YIM 96095]